jgi:hypothetical protein
MELPKNKYPEASVMPEFFYDLVLTVLSAFSEKDLFELKKDETIDYFEGVWKQQPLFFKDLYCFTLFRAMPYAGLELINSLRANSIDAAQYNYIGKNTEIPEHVDSDLTSDIVFARLFIPCVETKFIFKGVALTEREVDNSDGTAWGPITLDPSKPHSFTQLDENGHYIIADMIRKDAPKEKLNSYLDFAIKNYM